MIIWGSRTARDAKGFIIASCPCGGDRVHLVIELKTKFTLYFVPTFTTSRKAVTICTDCERATPHEGQAAAAILDATVSREVMIGRLEALAHQAEAAAAREDAAGDAVRDLAVAFLIVLTTVALVDRRVEQREVSTGIRALSTIAGSSAARIVREAAVIARDRYDELMTWIQAPSSGPLAPMLARAGRRLQGLGEADRERFVGQLAWLGQEVACAASPGDEPSDLALDRIDEALARMGVTPSQVARALAFCEANGG